MGELEPDDSRNVTLRDQRAPGEPPRTGPREGETRGEQHQQQQRGWRTDPGGQAQHQSQSTESNWRATEDREAQDHEFAGDIESAPSLRPDADDGQWSQQPVDDHSDAQPQQGLPDDDLRREDRTRGPRDSMRPPGDDAARREQAERGGG